MYDAIIIGAGPAGLSAALYAGRFRMNTLILEKLSAGGQIVLSPEIENYPGFPGGISTFDLVERFKKQVQDLGLGIEHEQVKEIIAQENQGGLAYEVKTEAKSYLSRTMIIASGATPKKLGINGEGKFIGRGVSYCGTCDGPLFRDKDIAVIGGGDRAIEEAIFLSGYAAKVYLVHRRAEFRASKILVEKLQSNPKVKFFLDSVAEEIVGQDNVEYVKIKNVSTGAYTKVSCQGVFIFVGIVPQTNFLKNFTELDEDGFVITSPEMRCSKEGVFACGDCRKKTLYQVITACAEGAIAADSAHKYLIQR